MSLDRSLNPHFFNYGGQHYHEIIAFSIFPVYLFDKLFGSFPKEELKFTVYLLARALSSLMIAGVVVLTYLIAKSLFDAATGLVASCLAAVVSGAAIIGHYATTDASSTFWYTMACFTAVYAWRRESRRAFLLGGLCSGLAAGVKFIGAVSIFPLLASFFLSGRKRRTYSQLGCALLMYFVGFLLSNPALILSPFEFLEGVLKEQSYNAA